MIFGHCRSLGSQLSRSLFEAVGKSNPPTFRGNLAQCLDLDEPEASLWHVSNRPESVQLRTQSMTAPKLSVVFVNYNSTGFLRRALETLPGGLGKVSCEVLVVDNASLDLDHVAHACREGGARLIRLKRNLGYGAAANRAAREARGEYLAIANPDLEFPSSSVRVLVEALDREPAIGAVGPQLVYPDGTLQPSARRFPRVRYFLAGRRSPLVRLFPGWKPGREFLYADVHLSTGPVDVEALIGTCLLFRRQAFDGMDGFDENYFMFAEDLDICRRLRERGWRVVLEPRSRVVHYYGGVRRGYRRFTEYHRLRALCRLLRQGRSRACATLIVTLCAAYYFGVELGWILGLQEREYSWHNMGRNT
jgi:N-acetylglucosaminyl-diphospho-decaprenol L-rhamnosyltransferase